MERALSQRALLVEDHDLLAQMVTEALRAEGVEVDRTVPGSAAGVLAAADATRHGLVLLDVDHTDERDEPHELIAQLHARGLRVVALVDSADAERSALDGGVSRVVRTDQDASTFRDAVGIRARRS